MMGYYSVITIETKIRADKLSAFRTEKRNALDLLPRRGPNGNESFLYNLELLLVDDQGIITVDQEENKWYAHAELARFLSPYVEKGDICFDGEDDVSWGYRFDGKGGFVEIVPKVEWVVKK